ncbi:MAG TPA: serine/threonine-protein kinase [Thiolapillus brandeum]|uniref:Serine/threonine-protein kinase n=1 Tax=Thiolapillus brandeum TaxID=1076588 RepID=A0A831W9R9_9GAMM|nr:serine/threonine-protein kinase [Thiolapillus brandeum]
MPHRNNNSDDLLAIWQEIEADVDAGKCKEDRIFEQGVSEVVPDLLERITIQHPDLGTGELLARYRILHPIGSGGMGDVYLAERADGQYEKRVALKIMSLGFTSPDLLARFQRERQIQAELNHPGIAKLLDAGVAEDGRPWFVLDYIQGTPLVEFCNKHHLDHQARIELLLQVCHAIAYAHDHGVVHRDLKPENILVKGDAHNHQPVVMDFGIASREQDNALTQMGNFLGTPAYSSPEQVKGNYSALDHHSDIFSLGILLYELIDNRRPFDGESNTEISYHIIDQDTPPLQRAGVSPDLSAIIFKCLEKSPRDRYSSVHELIEDLENYRQGNSVVANPVGFWFRTRRRIHRYPLLSALALLTFATVLTLAGLTVWQHMSKNSFAARQAQIAQRYGQAAQQIESGARLIYSRPLHNTEKEIAALETRYRSMHDNLAQVNISSRHVAHYALGRAALSLGNIEEAQQHLEQAWNAGLKEPLLALRLGQTYVKQYGKATRNMRQLMLSSVETRQQAFDQARKDYLQPAMTFLALGAKADHPEAQIAAAILRYTAGDTKGALEILQHAIDTAAWPVTAMIANGNFYLELAENSLFAGDNQQAYAYLIESENLFSRATQIARSHPDAITGNCIARTKLIQSGEYPRVMQANPNPDVIAPCDALMTVQPNNRDSLLQVTKAYVNTARKMRIHGNDPSLVLDKAETFVNRALQQNGNDPQALRLLGSLLMTRSYWRYDRGDDGYQLLNDAIAAFEKAGKYAPGDNLLQQELALALQTAGKAEYANGRDGNAAYMLSNEVYRQLVAQPDVAMNTWTEYADELSWQAYYLYSSGRDARQPLQEAIRIAHTAVEKSSGNLNAILVLAMAEYSQAEFLYLQMEDPAEVSAAAFRHFGEVVAADPGNAIARINQLGPLALSIDFSLDRGIPQTMQLEVMHELLLDFEQQRNAAFQAPLIWADYWRYMAKQARLDKRNPAEDIEKAKGFLKLALNVKQDHYEAIQSFGYLAVFEHSWRIHSGNRGTADYNEDLRKLSEFIKEYPDLPILRALRGQLRSLTAVQPSDWSEVIGDFQSSIAMNPLLEKRYGPDLKHAIAISGG